MSSPTMRRIAGWLLALTLIVPLALLAIPARIIHPFRAQTARGVEISYFASHAARLAAPVAALLTIAAAAILWRGKRTIVRRALLALATVFSVATAWFAFQHPFEWMFNPIQRVAYARTADVDWLIDRDDVMAIDVHGDAAAYPVRQMAYHHIVHDAVGGVPIVVTY